MTNSQFYYKKKNLNSKNKKTTSSQHSYSNTNKKGLNTNEKSLSTIKEEDSQNNKEGNSLYNQNEEEEEDLENNQKNCEENIDENNQNEEENENENQNENQNENYEQNQFNEFMRKLMKVESQIEDVKITLGKNPDFQCDDAWYIFDSNKRGYLEKNDIKNGLNLIGVKPSEQELNILMKRFDLQKYNFINYADFFDMVVPFDRELRKEVEDRQPKSPDNFSEKTINDLKNLFGLIIHAEKDINNDRKNFGTLRLKLKDIFGLIDKTGKEFFDFDEMMVYFANNNLIENNKEADLLFIRLDKNRNGRIDFLTLYDELQVLY